MRDSQTSSVGNSRVPRAALLDAWSSLDWSDGVDVTTLSPLDELTVTTRNSVYTIVVVSPATGQVKVRGGALFPSFASASLCGSSLGRGFLKRWVVHPGFCIEFVSDELGVVITSRVRTAVLTRDADRPGQMPVM